MKFILLNKYGCKKMEDAEVYKLGITKVIQVCASDSDYYCFIVKTKQSYKKCCDAIQEYLMGI